MIDSKISHAGPATPPAAFAAAASGLTVSIDAATVRPVMHMPHTLIGLLLLTRPAS